VFVADRVNAPAPDLVKVPVLVPMTPEIVDVPAESTSRLNVPVKPPLIVSVDNESICT
jgi:hypothetical protein